MNKRLMTGLLSGVLTLMLVSPVAAESRTFNDESIYDTLTDRFFDKDTQNNFTIDTLDPAAFSGGDFAGVMEKLDHIEKLGFTTLSIGPVFATDTYDGKRVLDYTALERHFGTEEELKALIAAAHERGIRLMVDVPTQAVSEEHVWFTEHPEWFSENGDGTVSLRTEDSEVQAELTEAIGEFIRLYEVDALRLQHSSALDGNFIRAFSAELKGIRDVYIVGDSETEPVEGLDATVLPGSEQLLREAYKTTGTDSADLQRLITASEGRMVRIDSLTGSRFTVDAASENEFPPTRWRLVFAQLLTMPGIPVVQYGSETAMNGEAPPESHQILDLRVDEELIERIGDWNSLRNSSEALRSGNTEVLVAEDGWLVYKRWNEEESWIISINNTADTKSFTVPAETVGNGKELRGLFESNLVRPDEDGNYRIVINRETAEAFTVGEERGLNKGYLAALALVYVLFMVFLWIVWKKGKQRKQDKLNKQND